MDWTKQIVRFIIVMLLQVLLFNRLQLAGICHPYVYILCLLMLPSTLPQIAELLIGAAVGVTMDIFCNSLGIHMAACVLIMFLRPYIIHWLVNDKDRITDEISAHSLGLGVMTQYILLLVLIHHLTVFLLASWSWAHIGFALLETLVSSIVTILVLLGYNVLKYR